MSISTATLQRVAHSVGELLYIGLDPVVRLCTRGQMDVLGETWLYGDFEVTHETKGLHGLTEISLTLEDPALTWSNRFMTEFKPGIPCEFYLMYRGGNGWETDKRFSGFLNEPRLRGPQVELRARLSGGNVARVPRVRHESPYSLARGAERVINGTTYRIE